MFKKCKKGGKKGENSKSGNKTVTISQYCSCPKTTTSSSAAATANTTTTSTTSTATPQAIQRIEYRMKERTSTINEDPSSHDDHPNQGASATANGGGQVTTPTQSSMSKPESINAGISSVAGGGTATKQHGVLTKNSSFGMSRLTTRLGVFFRKFSTSTSSSSTGTASSAGAGGSDSDNDVCPTCHRLRRSPTAAIDRQPGEKSSASGDRSAKRNRTEDGDEDDDGAEPEEEVDFTSNILVGDLSNLTSILKKPSATFRQSSLDEHPHFEENAIRKNTIMFIRIIVLKFGQF